MGASTAGKRGLMSGILGGLEGTTYCQVEDARRVRRLDVLFLLRDLGVGVELQARWSRQFRDLQEKRCPLWGHVA
jgi:hypothetical protein